MTFTLMIQTLVINPDAHCTNLNGLNEACRVERHGNNGRQTKGKKSHIKQTMTTDAIQHSNKSDKTCGKKPKAPRHTDRARKVVQFL